MDAPGNRPADGISTPPPTSTSETLKIVSEHHPPETKLQAGPSEDEARRQTIVADENTSDNIASTLETTCRSQTSSSLWTGKKDILNMGCEVFKRDQKEDFDGRSRAPKEELEKALAAQTNDIQGFLKERLDDFDEQFGALKKELEKELAAQTNNIQGSLNGCLDILKENQKDDFDERFGALKGELEKALAAQTNDIQGFLKERLDAFGVRFGALNEELEKAFTAQSQSIQVFLKEHLGDLTTHCVDELTEAINGATNDLASKVPNDLAVSLMEKMNEGVAKTDKSAKIWRWSIIPRCFKAVGSFNHFAGPCQSSIFGLIMMMAHSISVGSSPRLFGTLDDLKLDGRISWLLVFNACFEGVIMWLAAVILECCAKRFMKWAEKWLMKDENQSDRLEEGNSSAAP